MVKSISEVKVKVKIDELLSASKDEIKEYKAKRNGEITVASLLTVLLNELMHDEIEELVVVRKWKDGKVATGWTSDNAISTLGMVEILKLHIADEID